MIMLIRLILPLLLLPLTLSAQHVTKDSLFDANWKFHRGVLKDAEQPVFNDNNWRTLNLPHDWSIGDLPDQGTSTLANGKIHTVSGPFDSEAECGNHVGYTIGGTGWYRKHFRVAEADTDKCISIWFDGVYMNADVWINGHHLGNHPYGYTAFGYDLTRYLNYGSLDNVIAVEVKNEGCNSRWYTGSGIYRHVTLDFTHKLHAAHWGTFVKTASSDEAHADIEVKTTIENRLDQNRTIAFVCRILNPVGKVVAETKLQTYIRKHVSSDLVIPFHLPHPALWSCESPDLYVAECDILDDGKIIDHTRTTFGIRSYRFDPERGFFLNGKSVKLKGATLHADNGPLGAVANDRAEARRVELMKAAGYNAIRCSHNPPSSVFLDACDRLGMLVIEESFDVWTQGWLEDDYHVFFKDWWQKDLTSIVMRDRNHASVFAWGIGNQIRENQDSIGIALAYKLAGFVRTLDPTRAVTADVALFGGGWHDGPSEEWIKCDPLFAALDICGYSYQSSQYENDHRRLPNRVMYSIEINPRQSFSNWMRAIDHDYVIGNFEWTAMDYLGESAGGWYGFSERPNSLFPWHVSFTGDFDICGFRRPRSYYRDILFGNESKLALFVTSPVSSLGKGGNSLWGWEDVKPSWTWPGSEGKPLSVVVYSACDSVQLFLNNTLIGTKSTGRATEFKAEWQVPYAKGSLKAIGYAKGQKIAESQLATAGRPAGLVLKADKPVLSADGQDLCYVTVEITDKNGNLNPRAVNRLDFSVTGNGRILAVCNSDPLSLESYQQPTRKAYEGKCLVIVQTVAAPGKITLTASGKGLFPARLDITTK